MATRLQRISSMQKHILDLQKKIEELNNLPSCPLCGSEMRQSAKTNAFYCLQEKGHCGVLILNKITVAHLGHAFYLRTQLKDGKVVNPTSNPNVYLSTFYIAGKEVDKKEYLKAAEG